MSEFNETRRQKFLSEKDYVEEEDAYRYGISLAFESLSSDEPKAQGADSRHRWAIASDSLELLLLNYTAGRPIEELKAQLPQIIERFDAYVQHEVSPRTKNPPENVADTLEITQLDAYVYVLWLLALCKLLCHSTFIPTVVSWVDKTHKYNRWRDGLFENVVQALTGTHVETPRVVLHAKPYGPLASATVRAPEERPALVKEFVESWYKGTTTTYWHGAHTDGLYFGYWCLEAALVTVLFDIDDSSYRDHLVYPKDLVDWYRNNSQVEPVNLPPPTKMLKAMPGEPCPRSGEWNSPFLNRTVSVERGEPMPGPETDSSGNLVIWYLRND